MRLAAGARADRRDGGHLRVVALMLVLGAGAFAVLADDRTAAPTLVAGPLAFCTAWAWPGLFNLAVVRANPTRPAAATGITQTGTYIGAVSGPLLFGVIADRISFTAAWLVAAAFALARRRRHAPRPHPPAHLARLGRRRRGHRPRERLTAASVRQPVRVLPCQYSSLSRRL